MLNLKYVEFESYLRDKIKDQALVKKTVSIALGIALSRLAPLPTSEVELATDHYNASVRQLVSAQAGEFNENLVVDLDLVAEVARAHWLIRYFNAYPSKVIPLVSDTDSHFLTKIAGAAHFVSKDIELFCERAPELLITIINRIVVLMAK